MEIVFIVVAICALVVLIITFSRISKIRQSVPESPPRAFSSNNDDKELILCQFLESKGLKIGSEYDLWVRVLGEPDRSFPLNDTVSCTWRHWISDRNYILDVIFLNGLAQSIKWT